jgi:hypothetical protein
VDEGVVIAVTIATAKFEKAYGNVTGTLFVYGRVKKLTDPGRVAETQ